METIYVIIAVVLIAGIAIWFWIRETVDKPEPKNPKIPKPDYGWVQLLADLKTALAGIRTQQELNLLIDEFQNRIDEYVYNAEFMSEYTELINNWKADH